MYSAEGRRHAQSRIELFRRRPVLALLFVAAGGCAGPSQEQVMVATPSPTAADRRAIEETHRSFTDAVGRQDIETVLRLITGDAVFWPDGAPEVTGKASIRSLYETVFHDYRIEQRWSSEELIVVGDWAFDRGREHATVTRKDDAAVASVVDRRGLMILRRDSEGVWRYARSMSNQDRPARSTNDRSQ